jgi:hypothetical protein
MEDRVMLKIILCFFLLILLSSFPVYSQVEDRIKTEMVKLDLAKLRVNNENFLFLLDTFVLNKDYRTGYRKDYVHIAWIDSSHCMILISLQRKSVTKDNNIIGLFWRNDTPFIVGGDNPDDLFTKTGEKECFCFERTTKDFNGKVYDYPLNPEEFITWTFKVCEGNIEFIDAVSPEGRIRSDVSFSFEQPCCPYSP